MWQQKKVVILGELLWHFILVGAYEELPQIGLLVIKLLWFELWSSFLCPDSRNCEWKASESASKSHFDKNGSIWSRVTGKPYQPDFTRALLAHYFTLGGGGVLSQKQVGVLNKTWLFAWEQVIAKVLVAKVMISSFSIFCIFCQLLTISVEFLLECFSNTSTIITTPSRDFVTSQKI